LERTQKKRVSESKEPPGLPGISKTSKESPLGRPGGGFRERTKERPGQFSRQVFDPLKNK